MTKQTEVQAYLEKLTPMEVVSDKVVEDQFLRIFTAIHGNTGESQYEKEKFYFNKLLAENPALQECTRMSLFGAFLEIASLGLSLDNTSKPLCYMMSRSVKTGLKNEKGFDLYEKRAYLMVTGFGELVQRQRANQIKYADNPVIVYGETKDGKWIGDFFECGIDDDEKKFVKYKMAFPRPSNKVCAAFIKITRPDGTIDFQWLLQDDFERMADYSAKSNSHYEKDANGKNIRVKGQPNALYSSWHGGIDPGFAENKMIKHAFDSFPKVKTGYFSVLQTDEIEQIKKEEPFTPNEDVTEKEDIGTFGNPTVEENSGINIEDESGTF